MSFQLTDQSGVVRFQGSQSGGGGMRMLDLGLITAADVAAGAVTLYTPTPDEIVGPVFITDFDVTDTLALIVTYGDQYAPPRLPLAFVDAAATGATDTTGLAAQEDGAPPLSDPFSDTHATALTRGQPIVAGASTSPLAVGLAGAAVPWVANQVCDDSLGTPAVIGAGHVWTGTSGTTDVSEPDFAGNIGGTVTDNDITWTDTDTVPSAGQLHVYAYAATPVVP